MKGLLREAGKMNRSKTPHPVRSWIGRFNNVLVLFYLISRQRMCQAFSFGILKKEYKQERI